MITIEKTISTDFSKGLNSSLLYQEISDSSITRNISAINTSGDTCYIIFNGDTALSTLDNDILNTVISAHDGSITEPSIDTVTLVHPDGEIVTNTNPLNITDSVNPKDFLNKLMTHDTPRPTWCNTYITGEGDDPSSPYNKLGGGNNLFWNHKIGDPNENIYVQFNNLCTDRIEDFIANGWIFNKGCLGDQLTCEVVNKVTNITTGQINTNYNLYGGYMIIPAAGDGTIQVDPADMRLVRCLKSQTTGITPPGYWTGDWNSTTGLWENVTPVPDGTGTHNMFSVELVLDRFANHINMLDGQKMFLHIQDAAQFSRELMLKFHNDTNVSKGVTDHDYMIVVNLYLFRSKTL